MDKVCLTTFVYGDAYQAYIPFLAYSCNRAFPDYDMQIFVYGTLNSVTRKQIEDLNLEMKLIIHENSFSNFKKMTPLISSSLRWLLWDDSFLKYDYLYVVDIDILYISEEILLHEQHKQHMKLLNLPFSNVKRKLTYKPYKDYIKVLQAVKHLGVFRALRMLSKTERTEYKLTGLHFIAVNEYYKKLNQSIIKKEVLMLSRGKISELIYYPNDEIYLYRLLENVGFDLSKLAVQSDGGVKMLDPTPDRKEFRPEHGIHLGMFRSEVVAPFNINILESTIYKYYIEVYTNEIVKDEKFVELLRQAPDSIKRTFKNLHQYCGLSSII